MANGAGRNETGTTQAHYVPLSTVEESCYNTSHKELSKHIVKGFCRSNCVLISVYGYSTFSAKGNLREKFL